MSFTTIGFILFFLAIVAVYYILPLRVRNLWLFLTGCYFYLCSSKRGFVILVFVGGISYIFGLLIEKANKKKIKKALLIIGIIGVLSTLFVTKYMNFFIENLNKVMTKIGITQTFSGLEILLPLGISFFTLQAVGYMIDVYRSNVKAERNMIHYGLFISFFPYVSMGPIERAKNMLPQIKMQRRFNYENFCHGFQSMLWGFFVKLVVAERLSIMANSIFNDYMYYSGFVLFLGMIAYTLQIYCDFVGYTYIARGAGKALGFDIMENFKQPYFSRNISDFWRRWHIGLSSWLKDYVYIPLGGNRKGTFRKYLNIMIVFIVSGIWHGANWNFIAWGGLHGIYQVIGNSTRNIKEKAVRKLHIKYQCFSYKLLQTFITFLLVAVAWVFFRAPGFKVGLSYLWRMITGFNIAESFGSTTLREGFFWNKFGSMLSTSPDYTLLSTGLNAISLFILGVGLLIVLAVDILKYKKINFVSFIDKQNIWFRWIIYISIFFAIVMFGIYGMAYDGSDFIYSNF